MSKYITEFVGTFFLVLTIGCTVIGKGAGALAPLAIGSALMVMIFAGGHISGGHYNPAVTLGAWLRGKCETKDVAPYMLFQVAGAAIAAMGVKYLKGGAAVVPMNPAALPALLAEFLFTLALVFVVLNVATAKGTSGNSGPSPSETFPEARSNPAVAVGISLMGLSSWSNIWIYLVANFAGGAVAAIVFKTVNPGDN